MNSETSLSLSDENFLIGLNLVSYRPKIETPTVNHGWVDYASMLDMVEILDMLDMLNKIDMDGMV